MAAAWQIRVEDPPANHADGGFFVRPFAPRNILAVRRQLERITDSRVPADQLPPLRVDRNLACVTGRVDLR